MRDDEERELATAIRRYAEAIRVPAVPLRPQRNRPNRLLVVASVATVLVGAALVGRGLGQWRANGPAATPTSSTGTSAGSTASSVPAPVLDDRFGFLGDPILGFSGPAVRREIDPGLVVALGEVRSKIAVSPDGRRLAYWTGTAGSSDGLPYDLRVLDVAPGAQPRTRLSLTSQEFAGHIAWSSDGTGLVIGVRSESGPGADAPPRYSALRVLDLVGGEPREIARIAGGPLEPLAWDRQARLVAAYEAGAAGIFAYSVVAEGGTLERTQLGGQGLFTLEASHDAKQVLGRGLFSDVLRIWPLASPARAVELRANSGTHIVTATWRPGTAEIGVLFDDDRIELWDTNGARRAVPLPPIPATSNLNRVLAFRADGSAVFVGRALSGSFTGNHPDVYCVAVDLSSARSAVVETGGTSCPALSVRIAP
ncbi:MAG TPA: hypothetical protein VGS17_12850 [Candidatus Limnocylindria bacterium]|nr:hypothetical protein [Candidatus Limnocylindria bacterium]